MSGKKSGDDLKSFQIGNLMGPGAIGAPPTLSPSIPAQKVSSTPTAPASPSAGSTEGTAEGEGSENFPFLSALIEQDDEAIAAFGEEMGEVYKRLEELAAKRTGRIKQEAMKALRAYDLTFDLIDYLRQVKANLLGNSEQEEGGQ